MMYYANNKLQIQHLIITRFTEDYKEQIIITSIKSKVQYPIYISLNYK